VASPYVVSSIPILQDAGSWVRRHQLLMDWTLAAALATFCFDQALPALLVSVALAVTVVARHRHPVAAFAAAMALVAVQVTFGLQAGPTDLALVPLLYALAAAKPRRVSGVALAVSLVAAPLATLHWARHYQGPMSAAMIGIGGLALTTWVLGDSQAGRRAYQEALEERAARLEAERDAQARLAAAAERARELQERRARVIETSDARLHRIERDLHDGAQVRLTALAMTLGEIKESVEAVGPAGDERLRELVAAAHANAKQTLAELRDLARGIRPAVLDRGLEPALAVLAQASPARVSLTVSVRERPAPAIEAIAYFCAAELLANVAKHSGARHAAVSVSNAGPDLVMTVADDGAGQARLAPGGGLAGLRERVQTVDGRLGVDSPAGGPTIVTVELPVRA
jgi:signal transduction histidine kinase